MGLLSRSRGDQTRDEREQLRNHLEELDGLRERGLLELGGMALEMHSRDRLAGRALWEKAAEIAAIEDEAGLVRRGLDERLSVRQLEELARH
jgi:hypothetical protein